MMSMKRRTVAVVETPSEQFGADPEFSRDLFVHWVLHSNIKEHNFKLKEAPCLHSSLFTFGLSNSRPNVNKDLSNETY